ncbi:alpha/beta hydrolase [Candidatus Odyssella acanthamoebae]|uniref:Alpha/beta hydrolase n=1 Tax=Candidatus Odyssella acanthamoebae TaxID=91604 RepID=A0A077AV39_9PROT|nr:alpha/beta hydrolase [Candidatus Paracaedibacter acanthamoebae]AIK97032.1 alpha/beta hydrolase [Candidatus Paracaedibacter acanthamoebae]
MAEVIFNGAAGRIEGRYHQNAREDAPIALILHPNPQFGGTMNNKVVYALYRTFVDLGFSTLRINFRGVGRSEGTFDNGEGELNDAATALDWLQTVNPTSSKCFISGFSFGAWIAMQLLMRRPELDGFISVAPPADRYDFSFLAPCPVPGLILQGAKDDIVPFGYVAKMADKLQQQRGIRIDYTQIADADHFFSGKLPEMCQIIEGYVKQRLAIRSVA